jgi:hypothetical protein
MECSVRCHTTVCAHNIPYGRSRFPLPTVERRGSTTPTGAGEQAGTRALTSAHNEVESTRHYVGLGHKLFYLGDESVIADCVLVTEPGGDP